MDPRRSLNGASLEVNVDLLVRFQVKSRLNSPVSSPVTHRRPCAPRRQALEVTPRAVQGALRRDNSARRGVAATTVALGVVTVLLLAPRATSAATPFIRGDSNGDGEIEISDAIFTLRYLFASGDTPGCVAATDTNGDDQSDIGDAITLLNYLFVSGSAPAAPFPECGEADESSTLACDRSPCATDEDFLARLTSPAEFHAVSVALTIFEDIDRLGKFFAPARDDPSLLPVTFQNVNRHRFHHPFLVSVFPERFADLGAEGYVQLVMRRATREYFAGDLVRIRTPDETLYGFSLIVDPGSTQELLEESEVTAVYERLRGVVTLRPLAYAPRGALDIEVAAQWANPSFPIYLPPRS